ncbi:MAG: CPBP family intramembrane glutamic endopeptidase [Bacillota bacterium]
MRLIGAYGPAIAALITASREGGRIVVSNLLARIMRVRVAWTSYVVALLLPAVLLLLAAGVHTLIGGTPLDFGNPPLVQLGRGVAMSQAPLLILPYLLGQFLSVLGEEIGWRGYALPRLLSAYNWTKASLLLGVIWAIWHIPLTLVKGSIQDLISPVWYNLDLLGSAFLFTWLAMRSRGSVFIATLFHASINTATIFLPILSLSGGSAQPFIISVLVKWAMVVGLNLRPSQDVSQDVVA